ncbi:hypothetical protein FOTG_18925 [Fusarium oxysporum f. sp. vasinfectum 25433]|uniref:Uncharacterized protein n=1 Tax=Fusarium oxysporum f. sp. vasinfectum 25433 TaxID=1089449 RepID=X0KG47_FUSOX|nr:hypothetical protein FOTG_18925 [Fusarium oxysporum f. sp. vasinfectum 25433]
MKERFPPGPKSGIEKLVILPPKDSAMKPLLLSPAMNMSTLNRDGSTSTSK